MVGDFTTVKMPKWIKRRLHSFKARMIARKKRRVTDAEAVLEAVREANRNERKQEKIAGPTVWELEGFIKGGKPFNSVKELDRVVYGV